MDTNLWRALVVFSKIRLRKFLKSCGKSAN
jgi:hypothetical protein